MKKILILLMTIGLLASCEKEQEPKLIAMYAFSVVGPKVSFTNLSGYFDEYSWDFGDGQTSTEISPLHIYKDKGKNVVSLTAKKGSYTDIFTDTITAYGPTITIDGDFTDWDYIDYAFQNPANYTGSIKTIKTYYSQTQLFFLIEGTSKLSLNPFQMQFDMDSNTGTGYRAPDWFPVASGFEYMYEGNTIGWVVLMQFNSADQDDFTHTFLSLPNPFIKASPIVQKDGKYLIEISMMKDPFGNIPKTIRIGVRDLTASWGTNGIIPVQSVGAMETLIPIQTRD